MNLDAFTLLVRENTYPHSPPIVYVYNALALAGEAGEAADEVKKYMRDDAMHMSLGRRRAILTEVGDTLYYAAALVDELHSDWVEVHDLLAGKIKERQKLREGEG